MITVLKSTKHKAYLIISQLHCNISQNMLATKDHIAMHTILF